MVPRFLLRFFSPDSSTAFGQINRHPGVWYPEWLRAYLIVYYPLDHPSRQATDQNSPSHLPAGVAFSIVFVHEVGGPIESDEEDNEDNNLNLITDTITRSHMIDFSVSCWS